MNSVALIIEKNLFKNMLSILFIVYFTFRKRNFQFIKSFKAFFLRTDVLFLNYRTLFRPFWDYFPNVHKNKRSLACTNIIVVVVVVNSVVLTMGSLTNIPPNVPFAFHEQLYSTVRAANFERCAHYRECATRATVALS